MLRRFSFVILACALVSSVSGFARAERPAAEELVLARPDYLHGQDDGELELVLDKQAYRRLLRLGHIVVRDFPLPGRVPVDLELRSFDLLTHDARIVVVDENGARDKPRPAMRWFSGSVRGDPDSLVSLNLFEGRVAGFVRTWDDEFVIAPDDFDLAKPGSRRVTVHKAGRKPGRGACEGDVASHESKLGGVSLGSVNGIDGNTLLEAGVALDATFEWYDHFGSVTAAENYLLSLMAQVSTIYENDVKVRLMVPYLRIFTISADPYTDGSTDTGQLLSEVQAEWNANQAGVTRSVAHLFSWRPSGGAGRAFLNGLCSHSSQPGNSWDYGVNTLSATGASWEPRLVAHEIGHNFSSPHTHCYVPEIDRCFNGEAGCYGGAEEPILGTIMSYCNQKSSSFSSRVKDEQIRPAAEGGFGQRVDTAGLPGALVGTQGIKVDKLAQCPSATLVNDDGNLDQFYGYLGTAQMAWVKRFTPSCYPFSLIRADVMIGHASTVFIDRPIRLLVYTDPSGSGDPANATLAYSEDTTVQMVSTSDFNRYTLSSPVMLTSGDYYVGFYDLVADATTNYIASVDFGTEGDSWRAANTTSPEDFSPHSGGSWILRGVGGAVGDDGIIFQWGAPCNTETTPGQRFSVYRGDIGDFTNYTSETCSSDGAVSHLLAGASDNSFFLVVPSTSAAEGSYGQTSTGAERPPAFAACRPQSVAECL